MIYLYILSIQFMLLEIITNNIATLFSQKAHLALCSLFYVSDHTFYCAKPWRNTGPQFYSFICYKVVFFFV